MRHNQVTPFRSDLIQLLMLDMVEEAGIDFQINMDVVDVQMDGNRISGVVVHDGSDWRLYTARIIIDCTGDGAVSYKAGAVRKSCRSGRFDVQPMTTMFSIYGADDEKIDCYVRDHPEEQGQLFRSAIEQAMAETDYPVPHNKIGLYKGLLSGEWRMNCTRIQGLNPTIPEDLTRAYHIGLRQVFFLMQFMQNLPGLENARIKEIASSVGIRESRRIESLYSLELDDLLDPPKPFADSVAMGSFILDLHPSSGSRAGGDGRPPVANCFQIPYRILVPRTVDGLLAAGRCVSGSRDALSSIRVMPQAFALGQAAGTAAALCAAGGIQPRALDISALQGSLMRQNCVIR